MVGCSRIPGVPRDGDKEMSDNTDTVQTKGASHPTCIHSFTSVISVLYLRGGLDASVHRVLAVSCNWRPFDLEGEETTCPQRPVGMVLQQQEVDGGAAARRRAWQPGLAGRSDDGVTGWRRDEAVGETERRNEVAGGGSGREQAPAAGTSWVAMTRPLAEQGDDPGR
ncbi:hypothetical protein TRIUR3_29107 [Triticum urartu]|uniref:Uncharacterized protein n=1 Tax=Triticum urartu TaxID=4572 RepID=M7Z2Y6_TRIUA|nr:hypothetical protein TRIUR3_29107 [Triticum urartu]